MLVLLCLISWCAVDFAQQEKPKTEEPAVEKQESDPRERLPELPAREVLKHARILHIKARSRWFNLDKLESEIFKRKEFAEMGLEITRSEKYADVVIEVTRKFMTTRFTCTVIEPYSKRIVGTVTASSLGGDIEPDLADALIKQFMRTRSAK
jgi:hypothetical protein